jgi:hypothetical protein
MPAFDRIVAVFVLVAFGGLLLVRAIRAWADYRLQRRALDLLVRSVTEAEKPQKERRR